MSQGRRELRRKDQRLSSLPLRQQLGLLHGADNACSATQVVAAGDHCERQRIVGVHAGDGCGMKMLLGTK